MPDFIGLWSFIEYSKKNNQINYLKNRTLQIYCKIFSFFSKKRGLPFILLRNKLTNKNN